ncbi:MAG: hypothetical protein J6Z28_06635, partial [Succinivibrio sp.]|nr:hypothetical protein [Succinivibrio sp.]
AEIGKLKDANTIRKLLYKPTLTDAEKVTFKASIHSIISEMKNRMVNGVEVALAQGKDLKATANQLKEIFSQLSDKDADDSFMLDVKLREGFAKIDGIVNLSLPDAEDVNAYKTIDADDKTGLAAATAKLKTALPDLDERQIAKIIAFVPRNDEGIIKEKKLDAYIDVIKKGYPEFKSAMKEFASALKVNTPEAYAKAQLSFANVFEKVVGQAEGIDEISAVAANLVHFMNIKESSEFLDTINLNRIDTYYDSVFALRDTIPTAVNGSDDFVAAVNRETNSLVFSMTVLEQICYTVKANKTGDASMTPAETQVPDVSLKQNSDEGINAALMIGFLNQQKYMSKIDEKVSALPQGVRENAKELLTISLKDALRKTRYTSLEAHEQTFNTYLEKYFNTISNSPEFMKLLDKSSYKAENLTKFTDELIDGQKLFVNEFNKEKQSNKKFREDGVNKAFINDAPRHALISFNGVDFGAIESKDVVSTFCSMAEQNNVPASFIPFLTFYMSQSGLPYLVQADIGHSLTNIINPDLPSVDDLFDKGIGQIQNDYSNVVKVENNIMTITTDFKLTGTMIDIEKIPKNYMENNGTFPLQTMQINVQIDLTKGVDEQGVPKSITFLPPKVGQEIQ